MCLRRAAPPAVGRVAGVCAQDVQASGVSRFVGSSGSSVVVNARTNAIVRLAPGMQYLARVVVQRGFDYGFAETRLRVGTGASVRNVTFFPALGILAASNGCVAALLLLLCGAVCFADSFPLAR